MKKSILISELETIRKQLAAMQGRIDALLAGDNEATDTPAPILTIAPAPIRTILPEQGEKPYIPSARDTFEGFNPGTFALAYSTILAMPDSRIAVGPLTIRASSGRGSMSLSVNDTARQGSFNGKPTNAMWLGGLYANGVWKAPQGLTEADSTAARKAMAILLDKVSKAK